MMHSTHGGMDSKHQAKYERTRTAAVLVVGIVLALTIVAVVGMAVHDAFAALTSQWDGLQK